MVLGFSGMARETSAGSNLSSVSDNAPPAAPEVNLATPAAKTILVSVQGAVQKPGLLTVTPQTRVGQVIELAGGYSSQVDQTRLVETLNLAAIVEDGQQIWVPTLTDIAVEFGGSSAATTEVTSNILSLNTATQSELETLPGIGPVRAQAIISGRPYQAADELVSRQILSSAAFEALAGLVGVPQTKKIISRNYWDI